MSAFQEFVWVAIALFLWESILWVPLRGVVLRKRWSGRSWRVLDPRAVFATRELGLAPMSVPPDANLAPCQAPPLIALPDGQGFLIETSDGRLLPLKDLNWDDLKEDQHHFIAGPIKTRITSHRWIAMLRRARKRGMDLDRAVISAWKHALSPVRSEREWRRWKMVSRPLALYGSLLAVGFLAGLPTIYSYRGGMAAIQFALGLWILMFAISAQLWWLSKRVYPEVAAALRMDALLSLLVPFHAMRAMEIASVHAMGCTHPAAMLIAAGDLKNPWLASFVRRLLHPLTGNEPEFEFARTLLPLIGNSLRVAGISISSYDIPPETGDDPSCKRYCPRCHGRFLAEVSTCSDCGGMRLCDLPGRDSH